MVFKRTTDKDLRRPIKIEVLNQEYDLVEKTVTIKDSNEVPSKVIKEYLVPRTEEIEEIDPTSKKIITKKVLVKSDPRVAIQLAKEQCEYKNLIVWNDQAIDPKDKLRYMGERKGSPYYADVSELEGKTLAEMKKAKEHFEIVTDLEARVNKEREIANIKSKAIKKANDQKKRVAEAKEKGESK